MKTISKIVFGLLLCFTTMYGRTAYSYYQELKKLSETQMSFLVASYFAGKPKGFDLSLPAIIWKESSFGSNMINKSDGRYGSFGLAQILLQTAILRNKVKGKKNIEALKLRLIVDHKFNLEEAIRELSYWKSIYKDKRGYKYWLTFTIASYNNGWRSYKGKGKEYADDIKVRRKAIQMFFKDPKNFNRHGAIKKYLYEIRNDLIKEKVIR